MKVRKEVRMKKKRNERKHEKTEAKEKKGKVKKEKEGKEGKDEERKKKQKKGEKKTRKGKKKRKIKGEKRTFARIESGVHTAADDGRAFLLQEAVGRFHLDERETEKQRKKGRKEETTKHDGMT